MQVVDFGAFYAARYPRLVGQIAAVLGDLHEAEDIVQEAFARASVRWSIGFDNPEAWVRRVAFNLALQRLRTLKRQVRALARHGSAPAVAELSGDHVDLTRALARLSPRLRAVLVLHYVADLTVEEIAAQLRVPIGTVKSRLRRGREAPGDVAPAVRGAPADRDRARRQPARRPAAVPVSSPSGGTWPLVAGPVFLPGGDRLLVADGTDERALLVTVGRDGREVGRTEPAGMGPVTTLAVDRDGRLLLTATTRRSLRTGAFVVRGDQAVQLPGPPNAVLEAVAWTP